MAMILRRTVYIVITVIVLVVLLIYPYDMLARWAHNLISITKSLYRVWNLLSAFFTLLLYTFDWIRNLKLNNLDTTLLTWFFNNLDIFYRVLSIEIHSSYTRSSIFVVFIFPMRNEEQEGRFSQVSHIAIYSWTVSYTDTSSSTGHSACEWRPIKR